MRDTLRGLSVLHNQNIVHADIKANNVLVDWKTGADGEPDVERVQLADIEDAAIVPPGSDICGTQPGNQMWRSPEAHAQGPVNKPSDMFSFAILCIYAMLKRVIFAVSEEELFTPEGDVEPLAVIIERQISYFADEEGLRGLLQTLGDSPWSEIFSVSATAFNAENPRRPVAPWKGRGIEDAVFKDFISRLTNFDPAKRMTAQEALEHEWLSEQQ